MVRRTRPAFVLHAPHIRGHKEDLYPSDHVSEASESIEIVVNGDPRQVDQGTTVAALVASLGLASEHVAVERNRAIVPRAEHADTALAHGDALEIVTFVGGG